MPPSVRPPRPGHYRWLICGLLWLATTINYVDREALALLKPILDGQLHWTNADYGMINSVFQAAYAAGVLVFGWAIDRFGTKLGYTVSVAAWSAAAIGHAFARNVREFALARLGLGLGEAGNFPAAITAVAQWFPKSERALATAVFNSGANIGAVVAPLLVPWLAHTSGWPAAFVVTGATGALWLVLWGWWYQVPAGERRVGAAKLASGRGDPAAGADGRGPGWRHLLGYRQTWSFVATKFITDPFWGFLLFWLPDYFKRSRSLDLNRSWAHLAAIYSLVTVLSIFGGGLTLPLVKRGWTITRARKTSMLIFALGVAPILAVSRVGDWAAVALIGLAGAAHQAWSASLFTTVSDMFPPHAVGSVVGMGGLAGAVSSSLFAVAAGLVLDRFGAGRGAAAYQALFAVCVASYLLGFAVQHLLAPRLEPFLPERRS